MATRLARQARWAFGALCLGGVTWLLAAGGPGGPSAAQGQPDGAAQGPYKYSGSAYCNGCHTEPAGRSTEYVRLTESKIWKEQDKHSQAYLALTNPRSQQIAKLMQIKEITADDRCLNCHAANVPPALRFQGGDQSFDIKDGVSCDACHGPSSGWAFEHAFPAWRTKPAAYKKERGMVDVRDPAKRSQLCYSCHVGNIAEGKFVTHEMYAAGHPPLPGIEVATFSDEMPRHWRYNYEKPEKIQKLLKIDPNELEKTQLVVVGALAALERAAELVAAQSARKPEGVNGGDGVLDLANFDCYACHHDLKQPSWRQARGYAGTPGRPQIRQWPFALAMLGTGQGDEAKGFDEKVAGFRKAFEKPFGDRELVAKEGKDLASWLGGRITGREQPAVKYDQAAAHKILGELCSHRTPTDYDSARQVAWAFKMVYSEVKPPPAKQEEIEKVLEALTKNLHLKLPSGTKTRIVDELPTTLSRVSDYDPQPFQANMRKLAELLGDKGE